MSVTCFVIIHNVIGDQLYPLLWNAVSRLENLGFLVLALYCDGLSANRKFIRLHDTCSSTAVYKVIDPYAHDGDKRYIFFLQNHPCDTFSNFPGQAKKINNACIEMYG